MEIAELALAVLAGLDAHPGVVAAASGAVTWFQVRRLVVVQLEDHARRLARLEAAHPELLELEGTGRA